METLIPKLIAKLKMQDHSALVISDQEGSFNKLRLLKHKQTSFKSQ